MQPFSFMTFLLSYLLNLKLGPGQFRVINDQNQVRRFENGFMHNGNYNLYNGIRFRLWTRNNPVLAQEIEVFNRESLRTSQFDNRRLTKIFLHGANHRSNENRLDNETALVRDAYTTFADVNFILMDWTKLAMQTNYLTNNGNIAAERLAHFLVFLNRNGVPYESIHLIGHSWGAHVAGLAGRRLRGQVGRITGLDPAGPFYGKPFNLNPSRRLDKSNARFVDVIHVDAGKLLRGGETNLGIDEAIGHADFYPAGGSNQPGCPPKTPARAKEFFCNHEIGIIYFAESIGSPFSFPSCKCESWERFRKNECGCSGDDMSFMGEHAPRERRGTFYLPVRKEGPNYGLGPQSQVILQSITRAPTFIKTETKSTLSLLSRGKAKNGTGINVNTDNVLLFHMPRYSSKHYARDYQNDVINAVLQAISTKGE